MELKSDIRSKMARKIVLAAGHTHALHRVGALTARDKGYFKEEGLDDVEVTATGEDDLTIDALKEGKIDFAVDADASLTLRENSKGVRLYIIGSMINVHPNAIIGAKEIKTVADLKGKRIAGYKGDPFMSKLLRDNGLDPDQDVTYVPRLGAKGSYNFRSLEHEGAGLDRGDYQACTLSGWYSTAQGREQIAAAGYTHLAERTELFPGGFPHRVLATMGDMLEQHPQLVKGFLKGMIRAYRFGMEERNEAEVTKLVMSYSWARDLGWDGWDHELDGSFGRTARSFWNRDAAVKGLDVLIVAEKAKGMLPKEFTMKQVTRLKFQQEAAMEINAKFGLGGY